MQIKGDERGYVIGDAIGAVSTLPFRYYPKAAHVANRLGRIVAYVLHNPVQAGLCAEWQHWPFTYLAS